MSARNIDKFAELGRLLIENHGNRDDLSSDETLKLLQTAREPGDASIINAITAAFYMGYAAGYRRRDKSRVVTVGEYIKEQQAKTAGGNSFSN